MVIKQTHGDCIVADLAFEMNNVTNLLRAKELVNEIQSFFKLPFMFEETHVETLRAGLNRLAGFAANSNSKTSIKGLMDIFRRLLPQFSNRNIVDFFLKRYVCDVIMNGTNTKGESFVENLEIINAVVLECEHRPDLMNMLIASFERKNKAHLPSRIIEKIFFWLNQDDACDLRWTNASRRPELTQMLLITRNVVKIMPTELEARFLSDVFCRFLLAGLSGCRKFYKKQRLHTNSSVVKLAFSVAEAITAKVGHSVLPDHIYATLCFWATNPFVKNRSPAIMTVANLTRTKKDFENFIPNFRRFTKITLFAFACELFRSDQYFVEPVELRAIAVMLGNILEFGTDYSVSGYIHNSFVQILENLKSSNNFSALCFLVRKMVAHKSPRYIEVIKEMNIIQAILEKQSPIPSQPDQNDYQLFADMFETITMCHEHEPLMNYVREIIDLHSNSYFLMMFRVSIEDNPIFKNFSCKAFNHIMVMIQTQHGISSIEQAFSSKSTVTQLLFASHYNLKTKNHPTELIFQLNFWYHLLTLCNNKERSAVDLVCNSEPRQEHVNMIVDDIGEHKLLKEDVQFTFGADFLVHQFMSIFDYAFASPMNADTKYEMKMLSFQCLKLLFKKSDKAVKFFHDHDMISHVIKLLELSIGTMQKHKHVETIKKNGAHKASILLKDLILLLKSVVEWKVPLTKHQNKIANITLELSKLKDWLEAENILMNNFINLLRVVMAMKMGAPHTTGKMPLVKQVLAKIQVLSYKPPHSPTNLAIIRNGLHWLMACAQFANVRDHFYSTNIYSIFDNFMPHLHPSRKNTYDDVAIEWLYFFENLSRYDDIVCKPNHVNLLCRIIRLGNKNIKTSALRIIRNASRNSSISIALLNSEDFKNTVNDVLSDTIIGADKQLILQTLLMVGGQSEQGKAKLKNSSLNRQLKDQLDSMKQETSLPRSDSFVCVFNLAEMLRSLLDQ